MYQSWYQCSVGNIFTEHAENANSNQTKHDNVDRRRLTLLPMCSSNLLCPCTALSHHVIWKLSHSRFQNDGNFDELFSAPKEGLRRSENGCNFDFTFHHRVDPFCKLLSQNNCHTQAGILPLLRISANLCLASDGLCPLHPYHERSPSAVIVNVPWLQYSWSH
ncbi:hypothetical protein EI94DRAFT_902249 [Lactarius quietus]|nr:hypothetical protein EI94DRAFT_902249 [Lactarius quietus]